MVTYTLHVPEDARPGDPEGLDRAELIKDGFSWGAFIFTFIWFFVNRLWLAGVAVLVLLVGFAFLIEALDVHPLAGGIAQLLLGILIGLEANSVKRWTYGRRGRPAVAVVGASDKEEAEQKAFTQWLVAGESLRPAAPAAPVSRPLANPYRSTEPVIGLFPDAERGR
jgi:hypothetical protein